MGSRHAPSTQLPPPLRAGDRIDRFEFERRWEAMPEIKNAELIEGVVHMAAALAFDGHGSEHARLLTWLGVYESFTPGVYSGDNCTIRLDLHNEPQPDALLIIDPARGGQVRFEDRLIVGAPELVAEIAHSSVGYDTRVKWPLYQRHGVRECLIWRTEEAILDWYALVDGQYRPLSADAAGVVRSVCFPGLWLDVPALLEGRLPQVHAVLQQGLTSAEHADFVARLAIRET